MAGGHMAGEHMVEVREGQWGAGTLASKRRRASSSSPPTCLTLGVIPS